MIVNQSIKNVLVSHISACGNTLTIVIKIGAEMDLHPS